jgi:hypothetical protein
MALLTIATDASADASTLMFAPQVTGLIAGEDLLVGPCYIKSADGKVYMSNGTALNEAAEFVGFNVRSNVKAGQPVTLYGLGTRLRYATGMTPGDILYIGATAGRLDTAATTGDTAAGGTAQVITSTDIRIIRTHVVGK